MRLLKKLLLGIFVVANVILLAVNVFLLYCQVYDSDYKSRIINQLAGILNGPNSGFKSNYSLESARIWKDYCVRIFRKEAVVSCLEILKDGQLMYREENLGSYYIGGLSRTPLVDMGSDITGDGKANLVIQYYEGGAHNSETYLIFNLDESAKILAVVHDLIGVEFHDLNNDGVIEISGYENTFAYLGACSYSDSPRPKILLIFDSKAAEYVPDLSFMRAEKPNSEDLQKMVMSYQKDEKWHQKAIPPTEMIDSVLKLIYGGCEETGWNLFDMSWPRNIPGKEKYKLELENKLHSSSYAAQMKTIWSSIPK